MQRQALRLSEKVLGKEHPLTLTSMNNLSLVLRDQGKYEEAEATQRQALGLAEKGLGKASKLQPGLFHPMVSH